MSLMKQPRSCLEHSLEGVAEILVGVQQIQSNSMASIPDWVRLSCFCELAWGAVLGSGFGSEVISWISAVRVGSRGG